MITIKDLKEFLETLPEEYMEYELVNARVTFLDEESMARSDEETTIICIDDINKKLVVGVEDDDSELALEFYDDTNEESDADVTETIHG